MKQHVTKVAATCFYHLRCLRQMIRRRVGAEVITQLVLAFITSRLDYCNSALGGVQQTTDRATSTGPERRSAADL